VRRVCVVTKQLWNYYLLKNISQAFVTWLYNMHFTSSSSDFASLFLFPPYTCLLPFF